MSGQRGKTKLPKFVLQAPLRLQGKALYNNKTKPLTVSLGPVIKSLPNIY